nr:DUF2799 domain-containing protein [uncultured Pseudogulbenkiania sp.]
MPRYLLFALTVLLAGCATLNEQECRSKPASELGREDGRQGYGLWRLDKHVEACARFGLGIDRQAYLAAREQGLREYCTPDNGERVGRRGERYENVCPAELEAAFLKRYYPAYLEYRLDYRDDFWPGFPWHRHPRW